MKLLGVIGSGAIGVDPWDFRSWSGSSPRFFGELQKRGVLKDALGFELPFLQKGMFALLNISRDSVRWKRQLYMDVEYRNALSRRIINRVGSYDCDILQIGAMFNLRGDTTKGNRIYSYHDGNFCVASQSPYFPPGISQKKIQRTLDYEKKVSQNVDLVFVMSEYLRQSFVKDYNVPAEKVINVGAGINLAELPNESCLINKDYSNARILFIGIDFRRKGGHVLLSAFREVQRNVPRASLHIVGPNVQSSIIQKMNGVTWHGYLSKENAMEAEQLKSLMLNSSLFVMPSIYEPFGIAPLEAMAYGIPCIVTNDWALPEIVIDRICGRIAIKNDPKALADVMIEMLSSPGALKAYGQAGRRHVEEHFTWQRVAQRLISAVKAYSGSGV